MRGFIGITQFRDRPPVYDDRFHGIDVASICPPPAFPPTTEQCNDAVCVLLPTDRKLRNLLPYITVFHMHYTRRWLDKETVE